MIKLPVIFVFYKIQQIRCPDPTSSGGRYRSWLFNRLDPAVWISKHKFIPCMTAFLLISMFAGIQKGKAETLIFAGVILFSSGNGIMWPSFLSHLSKVAGQKYQGAVQQKDDITIVVLKVI